MSEIKILKEEKGQTKLLKVTDVYFYYTSVGENRKVVFDQYEWPKHKQNKFEWLTDAVMDEDTADELKEMFPKISVSKYTKQKFMERYKIGEDSELPFDAKKYYVVKVKQACQRNDGSPISNALKPRAILVSKDGNKDITMKANVGNGSHGDLVIRVNHSTQYGSHGYLAALLIDSLVEYEASGGVDIMSELGIDVELDEIPDEEPKKASEDSDEGFDDVPFDTDDEDDY
jgi:hypothetical protein